MLYLRNHCAKFGWNGSNGTWEEDDNVKVNRHKRMGQTDDGQHAIRNLSSWELKQRQSITCTVYSNNSLQFLDLIKIDVTFAKCFKLKNMMPFTDMKHIYTGQKLFKLVTEQSFYKKEQKSCTLQKVQPSFKNMWVLLNL